MLQDGRRIQIDLTPVLHIDKILLAAQPLHYTREATTAVFIDFPQTLHNGRSTPSTSTTPATRGDRRFGGITFRQDSEGHPWISTPPAKNPGPASGGPTRISGATK